MSKIRRVSWKNKDEWTRVFEQAYSTDLDQVERAVCEMQEWLSRGLCPGGVKCTLDLLTYVCRDRSFFPDLSNEKALPDSQLQFAYSSLIMRFLNVLYETSNKNDHLTLYNKAKLIGLEEWLVHIRHLTAHGKQLPSVDFLRLGVTHTLQWLKANYWEIENTASEDLVIAKPLSEMHREKLTELLTLYTLVSEQLLFDVKTLEDIPNEETRQLIQSGVANLSELKIQTIPWQSPEDKPAGRFKLRSRDLDNLSTVVFKLLKSYFKSRETIEQSFSILVDFLVQDHFSHHKIRSEVFSNLFKKLHAWQVLGKFIEILVGRAFPRQVWGIEPKIAGDWLVDLLKAVVKRFKVEKLLTVLTKESTGRRSAKVRARLTPDERTRLFQTLLKKKLSIQTGQPTYDVKILATLMHRVEKKNPSLKTALRLREAVFLPDKTLLDLLYKVCRKPNSYTLPALDLLSDMLTFRRAIVKNHLMTLVNLYCGNEQKGKDRKIDKWKMKGVESFLKKPVVAYPEEMTTTDESDSEDAGNVTMPDQSLWVESAECVWDTYPRADQIPADVLDKIRLKDAISVNSTGQTSLPVKKLWTTVNASGGIF